MTSVEQGDGSCAVSMFRESIDARAPAEIFIKDLIQDQEDGYEDQLVQGDDRESTRLQKLIIRPGDEGGVLTWTDFSFAKFCAEGYRSIKQDKHENILVGKISSEHVNGYHDILTVIPRYIHSKISFYIQVVISFHLFALRDIMG
jgi:hypothetical protein